MHGNWSLLLPSLLAGLLIHWTAGVSGSVFAFWKKRVADLTWLFLLQDTDSFEKLWFFLKENDSGEKGKSNALDGILLTVYMTAGTWQDDIREHTSPVTVLTVIIS